MNILINYVGRNGAGPQYAFEMAKGFLENGAKVYVIISSGITNLSQCENLGVEKIWQKKSNRIVAVSLWTI